MTVPFQQSESLSGIAHGFFGRQGGVSSGSYAGLNVSETGGDDFNLVAENRRSAASALGFKPTQLATLKQVHSNRIVTVTAASNLDDRPEADGLVTNCVGIVLGVLTADCAPILFADPIAGIVGAAHAGWQGAVNGVITNTVDAMLALGALPSRIIATLGPTISQQNYEVGPQFMAEFLTLHPNGRDHFVTPAGGREHFDLPGFITAELQRLGVGTITDLGICTYGDPERYFSHRFATHAGRTTGRQIALIGMH